MRIAPLNQRESVCGGKDGLVKAATRLSALMILAMVFYIPIWSLLVFYDITDHKPQQLQYKNVPICSGVSQTIDSTSQISRYATSICFGHSRSTALHNEQRVLAFLVQLVRYKFAIPVARNYIETRKIFCLSSDIAVTPGKSPQVMKKLIVYHRHDSSLTNSFHHSHIEGISFPHSSACHSNQTITFRTKRV